ncbi:thioesterase-like superfamily-domain-containing protein [Pseudoneurospora amorphoporcata]|uniref:Thioesterase-like superfamily-domain-containing protein n=1 Tax=Pseudoneurospora amorphoporcata TaxID=241081 RepID=A0AAN6P0Z7_9PEZI|nr:thioesterase-like superfamily-domain-containing protein [Pseudoneurospora amorphoporcata]
MSDSEYDKLLSFQEALELVKLPPDSTSQYRFIGTRSAYLPGCDYPPEKEMPSFHSAAYGGHVYAQSALAACRTWSEIEDQKRTPQSQKLGLHTIHGFFTAAGNRRRPFIYSCTPLTSTRSFSTLSVTAYQPSVPSSSSSPTNDHFPVSDAALPLAPSPCFTAIISFKASEPHSAGIAIQEPPPQIRFRQILGSRKPTDWPPAPPVDIDGVRALVGEDVVGRFPVVEMRKVDMSAYNEGKPVHERRELLLYRLLRPLPLASDGNGDGMHDANNHAIVHAYVVDRNGLLMACNHLGMGWTLGKAASLSYSLVFHTNVDECVMRYGARETGLDLNPDWESRSRGGKAQGEDPGVWWIQEAWFPRAGAGRGIVESKIWSPGGVHVATEYQDGLIRSFEKEEQKPKWNPKL